MIINGFTISIHPGSVTSKNKLEMDVAPKNNASIIVTTVRKYMSLQI